MEPAENKKNFLKHPLIVKSGLHHFPKTHLLAAGVLGICLSGLLTAMPNQSAQANRQAMPLALKLAPQSIIESATEAFETAEEVSPIEWRTVTVGNGDNLSLLFKKVGLNDRDIYELFDAAPDAKKLRNVFPGHQLAFNIDESGKLQQLRYIKNKLSAVRFDRDENGFSFQDEAKTPDIQIAYRESTITSSLIAAAAEPGVNLDIGLTMQLANIFGWDIDFALDIRKGDAFKVLYEEKFLEGERLGHGDILAAEFTNQGTTYKAVRYVDEDGDVNYYTPEGDSMRKDFLRAPVDFRRISSNFNPRRLHPVTKSVRPHRGTDYAAATGTPVWAAGDGRVVASSYTKANGNYVVIQHTNGIQTKYLHLHKRKVKNGQRVRQQQVIGTVGATGLVTGPHLHYEFLVNGVHRNPRTIVNKLPKAKAINKDKLDDFLLQSQPFIAQLDQFHSSRILATNDTRVIQ